MKLKSIQITGLHNIEYSRDYEFENINYIIGQNGSGKSTILQAIQFGIFGYFPGTNKRSGDILTHSNDGNIEVNMKFDDGVALNRSIKTHGKSTDSDFEIYSAEDTVDLDDILGNAELPVFNFSEFLSLSSNQQKDVLFSILPGVGGDLITRPFLMRSPQYSPYCESLVDAYIKEVPNLNSIENIKKLNSLIKESKKLISNDEKRLASTAQSLVYYDDVDSSKSVEELKAELNDFNRRKFELEVYIRNQKQKESCEVQLIDARKRLEEAMNRVPENAEDLQMEYAKKMLDIKDKINIKRNTIQAIKANISTYEDTIAGGTICPILCCDCDALQENIDELYDTLNRSEKKLQAAEVEYQSLLDKADEIKEADNVLTGNIWAVTNIKKTIEELECQFNEDLECNEKLTLEELDNEISKLADEIAKAGANAQYETVMANIQESKMKAKLQLDFLKDVEKATSENGLQSDLMQKPFEELTKSMKSLYQSLGTDLGDPKFILTKEANSFRFGLKRDKFIPFNLLSSGEKCLFVIVLLSAIANISTAKWKLVMVDDLLDHLDSNNFQTVINNISKLNSEIQYIFAGVKSENLQEGSEVNIIKVGD